MLLAQVTMIVLHAIGGSPIAINPTYIVSVYPTKEAMGEKPAISLTAKGGRCIVTLADGKFFTVTEDCHYIRNLITRGR